MVRSLLAVAIVALFTCGAARADWDDNPGAGFSGTFLVSTPEAPCGVGTPPVGHLPPDIPVRARRAPRPGMPRIKTYQAVKLVVRQDANRLCYVFGDIAEAPVIRVRQGDDLFIQLRNEITDPTALDKAIPVRHLDQPNPTLERRAGYYPVIPAMRHAATGATNLHLHGFAVPPTAPGDEVLNTCIDPAVGPAHCGRREFTYKYHVDDTMPAGLYWYHPHVHGEVTAQMLLGLAGPIVVEGPEDDARRAAGIEDRVFTIRQARDIDAPNTSSPSRAAAPAQDRSSAARDRPVRRDPGGTIDTAHEVACSSNAGTDELTLNGSKVKDGPAADSDLPHLDIQAGRKQLWRVLNAATDAFLDLALIDEAGNPLTIEPVARDGVPLSDDAGRLLPVAPTTQSQPIPPAGRLEFLIAAPAPGHKAYLVTHAVNTGCVGDTVPERRLAYVTSSGTAPVALAPAATPQNVQSNIFSGLLARKSDRERIIAFAEYPHPGSNDLTDYYIAERQNDAVLVPFQMGLPPAITVKGGTTEEWVVENWTNELHAFHMHQLHFRVLEIEGTKLAEPPLLDTITIPAAHAADVTIAKGPVAPGRVRIKVYFPPELAGDIPVHCHLVDHEDAGMMTVVRVLPPDGAPPLHASLSGAELLANPPICRVGGTPARSTGILSLANAVLARLMP